MRRTGRVALLLALGHSGGTSAARAEVIPAPDEPSPSPRAAWLVDAHVGTGHLGNTPGLALSVGTGFRWPLSRRWELLGDIDLGFTYFTGILGPRQYESFFGVVRGGSAWLLDDDGFFRVEAMAGAGPAHLSVTGEESNVSSTVMSYVVGIGFGAGWFHLEADYFGHRAEPCENVEGRRLCYSTEIGAAVLLGVVVPLLN